LHQATFTSLDPRITLTPGPNSLFDADGSSIVLHALPDDQHTDPSGNSGGRIGCGVITKL
jgi:Cu-Zn family superoxide dismutase